MKHKYLAIVTGGTRGIGLAITKSLRDMECDVIAFYHGNEEAAKKCRQETKAKTLKVNITNFEACHKAVEEIKEKYGQIHILVNNAGITRDGTLHKMSQENWNEVIDTNLNSCFNMCRAVIPDMREHRYGRIINISSINGEKGQFGQTNYAAAKAGMLGFTKALALESASRGITVNAICPGYIETEMTSAMSSDVLETIIRQIPAGRMGKPEEIGEMVAYLASKNAAFINGAAFDINGGQYMR